MVVTAQKLLRLAGCVVVSPTCRYGGVTAPAERGHPHSFRVRQKYSEYFNPALLSNPA